MAHLGFSSQYVLPELRTKPFIEHRVHRELMVEPDGQLNVHLAFAPGLTTGQSRAMVRDMEREQRRQFQDADRQRQQLLREKQLQAQSAAAASEQSELQLLTQRLFAVRGRLESKVTIAEASVSPKRPSATVQIAPAVTTREQLLADALERGEVEDSAAADGFNSPTRRGVTALRPPENSPQSLAAVHQPFSCRLQLK
jgi:hypothetical protein